MLNEIFPEKESTKISSVDVTCSFDNLLECFLQKYEKFSHKV